MDFAQARMYSSKLGRFSSADEPIIGQDEFDPQTWNLYIYTSNNPLSRIDPNGRRWFYRTVENTLEIKWVNPNEDGTFTSPEGEGWAAQTPGKSLSLYSAEEDTMYYLGEFSDGTPYINGIKTNRGVQDVSLETFYIARGGGSVLKGIANAAKNLFVSFLAKQAEKALIKELAELSTGELMKRVGKEGVETFRDVFGREFGDLMTGAEQTKFARELIQAGIKKIPENLTREQLLVYRQIAANAIKNGIDKGNQAERIITIDYLLTKVKN